MKQETKKLVSGIGTNDLANDIEKQQEIGLTPELYEESTKAWNNRLNAQKKGRATVCEAWQLHSNFARWWLETHIEDWCIDKDWLTGGKEYSPSNCVWIPPKINTLMNDGRKKNNGLPMGVSIQRNKYKDKVYEYYKAQCSVDGVQEAKNFKNQHEAHRQWQQWKIQEIDNVLREYSFDYRIDGRVIQKTNQSSR
ncbi:Uncharacterised protein [Serratia quinivorans]|uniref:Uncharacterized protein n=1 Tax=Serratia quinivorans TaxID=137545 RepID=A0A380AHV7_9GAMM|nr:Uncharacterised protein [Serratia quinivorans]